MSGCNPSARVLPSLPHRQAPRPWLEHGALPGALGSLRLDSRMQWPVWICFQSLKESRKQILSPILQMRKLKL